ncbi:MAG: rane protein, partial [Cryobacterium sp.]|nr:rane protein [Cryobacterium sp.]
MTGTCLRGRVFGRIPVDPDAPEAQQWLRDELAEAPYQAAQPTWFDRVSQGFFDWLNSFVAP